MPTIVSTILTPKAVTWLVHWIDHLMDALLLENWNVKPAAYTIKVYYRLQNAMQLASIITTADISREEIFMQDTDAVKKLLESGSKNQ